MAGMGGKQPCRRYADNVAITSRGVRLVAFTGVALLIVGTHLYYRFREPPTRNVAGRYVSNNCGVVTITGTTAHYLGEQARFKLVFDKFGLVGELERPLGPFYVSTIDGREEPGWLSFDKDTVNAVRFDRQECNFRRAG
jgi:hypothetical protein